jgi:hypothetical protein
MVEQRLYGVLWSKVGGHLAEDFARLRRKEQLALLKVTARRHAREDFHMIEDCGAAGAAWDNALDYCVQCLGIAFDDGVPPGDREDLEGGCRHALAGRPTSERWFVKAFWDARRESYLFLAERNGVRVDAVTRKPGKPIGWILSTDRSESQPESLGGPVQEYLAVRLRELDEVDGRA